MPTCLVIPMTKPTPPHTSFSSQPRTEWGRVPTISQAEKRHVTTAVTTFYKNICSTSMPTAVWPPAFLLSLRSPKLMLWVTPLVCVCVLRG